MADRPDVLPTNDDAFPLFQTGSGRVETVEGYPGWRGDRGFEQ